jgi:hypothetical protein
MTGTMTGTRPLTRERQRDGNARERPNPFPQVSTGTPTGTHGNAPHGNGTPPPLGGVPVPVVVPSARVWKKVARLLTTGSVNVLEVYAGRVLAQVIGDHGCYRVTFDGRWRCTCPAPTYCSHAIATSKVVTRPREEAR